jgi:hypothetical protein
MDPEGATTCEQMSHEDRTERGIQDSNLGPPVLETGATTN